MRRAWLGLVACAACSGLEPLAGTCGDGVVDPGEDCDSASPSCRACSIDCATSMCPDGYACGVDKLCHAPGGRFASTVPTSSQPFGVFGFGVTDSDGDGYPDAIGLSKTSLDVLHGDAAGLLARSTTALIPTIDGPPAVSRIDADATLDLVIPTADGLVAYTSPYGVISPYPFPIELDVDAMHAAPISTFSLDQHYLALVIPSPNGKVAIAIVDANQKDPTAFGALVEVCPGISPASLDPALFDHYDVPALFPARPSHVVAMATSAGVLCTVEVRGPAFAVVGSQLPGTLAPGKRPILARLQASDCPSLVGVDAGGGLTEYKGTGSAGACTFVGTRALPALGDPLGHVPLTPPVPNVGPDALAFTLGVEAVALSNGAATALYRSTRGIASIASTDLDGDGDVDVVASAGGIDDLEILYRYGTGTAGDPAGFLGATLDTVGAPQHLLTGDFDGDGVGDLTYTEALTRGERLMIVFGSRDHVQVPALVSTYNGVITTAIIQLANSGDPTGQRIDDLFVLDRPPPPADPSKAILLTILYGSAQRILIPFFDPRPQPLGSSYGYSGAVTGAFGDVPADPLKPGFLHLLGVERYYDVAGTESRLWLMKPTPLGAMQPVPNPPDSAAIGDCPPGAPPPYALCANTARYIAWHGPRGAVDIVFGIDQASQLIAFDPRQLAAPPAHLALATEGPVLGPGLEPRQQYVADVDGDGTQELIAGFGSGHGAMPGTFAGAVVACTYDGAIACKTLDVPALAGWTCFDAAPGRIVDHQRFDSLPPLDPPPPQDLAVSCRKDDRVELFRVFHDATGFRAAPLLPLPITTRLVQIADVTGDGVDDVLVFDDDPASAIPVLHVYPQCTSRQITTCRAPEAVP